MASEPQYFRLSARVTICHQTYGAARGTPYLYFHGLPGCRLECRLLDRAARAIGARIVAMDRPGYGGSSPQPQLGLRDWISQVGLLADSLGLERFGVLGLSGGGPCALASADRLGDRVTRAGIVCGLGPLTDDALRGSMATYARLAFRLADRHSRLLDWLYGAPATLLCRHWPGLVIRGLGTLNGGRDRVALTEPDAHRVLAASFREAFRQGPAGAARDLALYARAWDVDLASISVPVHLWHGDRDTVVPLSHGRYLHQQLPCSQLTVKPGEGHFSLPIYHGHALLADFANADKRTERQRLSA